MVGIVALAALILGACGDATIKSPPLGGELIAIHHILAAGPGTSNTTTASTSPTSQAGSWVDATANLTRLPAACGNVTLVSGTPGRDVVIAGVSGQGLWALVNDSPKWTSLGQGVGSASVANRPSSITYDPGNPSVFWESGIYGPGFYQTNNGGITFTQMGSLGASDFVSVDLTAPAGRILLSGLHERSSLLGSTDGGVTWVDLSSKLPPGVGYKSSPLVIYEQLFLLVSTGNSA